MIPKLFSGETEDLSEYKRRILKIELKPISEELKEIQKIIAKVYYEKVTRDKGAERILKLIKAKENEIEGARDDSR